MGNSLKAVDTIGNCQRLAFTVVSQHMHKITNLWKFNLNRSSNLRDNNERKRAPLSHEVVCVQMVDFETSNSKSEVLKSNSWKITSFSKTMALQREPFLTVFYTINLSPLFVTKKGLMLTIILSNYQQCPLPLSQRIDSKAQICDYNVLFLPTSLHFLIHSP